MTELWEVEGDESSEDLKEALGHIGRRLRGGHAR